MRLTRRPLYSIQREFFLGSVTSSPAMVAWRVEGGIARRPVPTRMGCFFFWEGIRVGSIMSPGRTMGSRVVVMVVLLLVFLDGSERIGDLSL